MPSSIACSLVTRYFSFAALLLVASSIARADAVVVVPPHLERGAGGEVAEQALDELTRLLKVQGFDVVSAGQSGPTAEAEQQRGAFPQTYDPLYCITPACANEYRRLFDAIFAVQLTVAGKGLRTSRLSVVLTEGPRAFFRASAPVEGLDVRSAVRLAFNAARGKQLEGAGPWLSVEGSPSGSLVYVDRAQFGRLPFHKRHIEPGFHRIDVRAEGGASEVRHVHVPTRIDHVETITVRLDPSSKEARGSEDASYTRSERVNVRSRWDWILGGVLVGVGAAHLSAGAYQKTQSGSCAESEQGRCTSRYGDRDGLSRENMLLGFGAASLAFGAAVMWYGPIGRVQVQSGVDQVSVRFTGMF